MPRKNFYDNTKIGNSNVHKITKHTNFLFGSLFESELMNFVLLVRRVAKKTRKVKTKNSAKISLLSNKFIKFVKLNGNIGKTVQLGPC